MHTIETGSTRLPSLIDPRPTMAKARITANELPQAGEIKRWVASQKALVVLAVKNNLITREEALGRYLIGGDELDEWTKRFEVGGISKLRLRQHPSAVSSDAPVQEGAQVPEQEVELLTIVEIGKLDIDLAAKKVFVDGSLVRLTTIDYRLLEILAVHSLRYPDGALSRERIFKTLYLDRSTVPELKTLDVFICNLRKKLGEAGTHLETIWGRGYRLRAPE